MMANNINQVATSMNIPSKLKNLAATSVIQLLIYEDYNECNFYRWDPVCIWQYETHKPKKKKGVQIEDGYGHPPPPWKGIQVFHKWWLNEASYMLGSALDSSLRVLLINALERQSWSGHSEEEELLFLLVRLCIDTTLHLNSNCISEQWYYDVTQIIEMLGPFPLQKVIIESDIFKGNSRIPYTIIRNSPNLQVLRISQWQLSDDILLLLPHHCPLLQEFSIYDMEPDVYMNEEVFFKCFFSGMSKNEVTAIFAEYSHRRSKKNADDIVPAVASFLSFPSLRYVDILFCIYTESLITMLAYFYPKLTLSTFSMLHLDALRKAVNGSFVQFPFIRLYCNPLQLKNDNFSCMKFLPSPKQLRLEIGEKYPCIQSINTLDLILEEASENLKLLVSKTPSIDSLALRFHLGTDITKVVLPTFASCGTSIISLYFVYDVAPVCINTLYQLLNLCPMLRTLVIELSLYSLDISSQSFRTELRDLEFLETVIFLEAENEDVSDEDDVQDIVENAEANVIEAYYFLLWDLLGHAPKLKNLSIPHFDEDAEMRDSSLVKEDSSQSRNLLSISVEMLHLNHAPECYCFNLSEFLLRFPSLKWFSLSSEAKGSWSEMLDSISHRGVELTQKKFEFTNVFRWNEKRHNFIYNSMSQDFVQFWC